MCTAPTKQQQPHPPLQPYLLPSSVGRWHQKPSSWFSTFLAISYSLSKGTWLPAPPIHPLLWVHSNSITTPLEGQCRGWFQCKAKVMLWLTDKFFGWVWFAEMEDDHLTLCLSTFISCSYAELDNGRVSGQFFSVSWLILNKNLVEWS